MILSTANHLLNPIFSNLSINCHIQTTLPLLSVFLHQPMQRQKAAAENKQSRSSLITLKYYDQQNIAEFCKKKADHTTDIIGTHGYAIIFLLRIHRHQKQNVFKTCAQKFHKLSSHTSTTQLCAALSAHIRNEQQAPLGEQGIAQPNFRQPTARGRECQGGGQQSSPRCERLHFRWSSSAIGQ